ncbi:hypothetical protein ACIBEA_35575 [Streptomyces sp. NPDC051555]|uniref:TRADD-N-associated membrane domain-containing protein n=1 Tax=Streptomyces sp. NPDC051555 TaxID=3365657 RepID=UPI0037A45505
MDLTRRIRQSLPVSKKRQKREWFENERKAKEAKDAEILARRQRIEARRKECKKDRKKRDRTGWICVGFGLAVLTVAAYFGLVDHHLLLLLCGAFYGTLLAVVGLFVLSNKTVEIEMQSLADEEELLETRDKAPAVKSYRLFKQHQQELKRYYDQSLSHAAILFFTGIACIIAGLSIVGVTLYILTRQPRVELPGQILIGALGGISAILSNFIAAIFLKMFKTAAESLSAQHRQLTSIHFLHFGNFLAEKLTSEDLRDDTLSAMCTSLAGALNVPEGGPGAPKGAGPP